MENVLGRPVTDCIMERKEMNDFFRGKLQDVGLNFGATRRRLEAVFEYTGDVFKVLDYEDGEVSIVGGHWLQTISTSVIKKLKELNDLGKVKLKWCIHDDFDEIVNGQEWEETFKTVEEAYIRMENILNELKIKYNTTPHLRSMSMDSIPLNNVPYTQYAQIEIVTYDENEAEF